MKHARRLLPYLATLLILSLLLAQINPLTVWQLLMGAQWKWLCAGLGWYLVTNVVRAYRFGVLLPVTGLVSPLHLLPDMVALSFFNNVLPARGGELSFPPLMARRHGVPPGKSAALLLIVRLFDFLAVATLYLLFAFWERRQLAAVSATVVTAVAILFLPALVVLLLLPWLGRQGVARLQSVLCRMGLDERPFGQKIIGGLQPAVAALARVHAPRTYLLTFAWSIVGWLSTFAWFCAFLRAVALAKALPFLTVGGFGAHDAGWAFGFHLLGMEKEGAIAGGLAINILTLLASLAVGMVAFVFMRTGSRAPLAHRKGR